MLGEDQHQGEGKEPQRNLAQSQPIPLEDLCWARSPVSWLSALAAKHLYEDPEPVTKSQPIGVLCA